MTQNWTWTEVQLTEQNLQKSGAKIGKNDKKKKIRHYDLQKKNT